MQEFNVERRNWLRIMYDKCKYCINCYLNDTFWADKTTGKSKSMNAYSMGLSTCTILNEFVVQNDKAVCT